LAELRPQHGLDIRRAGQIDAASLQPLQFGQQEASCLRRKPLQEVPYPFGWYHGVAASAVSGRTSPPERPPDQGNHETVRVSLKRSTKIGKNWLFRQLMEPGVSRTDHPRQISLAGAGPK